MTCGAEVGSGCKSSIFVRVGGVEASFGSRIRDIEDAFVDPKDGDTGTRLCGVADPVLD